MSKYIKAIKNCFIIITFGILITACVAPQPMMFGVPADQWSRLTQEQQDEVIRGYNQRQAIETANVPIFTTIHAVSQAVEQDQQRKQFLRNTPNFPSGYSGPSPQFPQPPPLPLPPIPTK